jgi:iron(III) transport system ATP-binding protein
MMWRRVRETLGGPLGAMAPSHSLSRTCDGGAVRKAEMTPVRIRNLTKRYGDVYALNDVSLAVEGGELFFLLGPSGCGKTTLLRSVAGFVTPDAGSIQLGERDITNTPPNQRDTAMVFQNYALWPHMTVADNVGFGLEVQKVSAAERRQRIHETLALVQMESLAGRKPNQLSGGQQQRVALARALIVKPKCLLLDEPLSNLDAKLRLHMRRVIRRLCKQLNLTTIYVTHDQKEALSMADRIAVLRDGKVEQIGTPTELYNRPGNRFVAEFVGETNFIEGQVAGQKDGFWIVQSAAGAIRGIAAGAVAAGTAATISVRPEAIRVSRPDGQPATPFEMTQDKPGAAPANRIEGTLLDMVYLGEFAQYEVRIAGGAIVKVMEQNPKTAPPEPGRKVWLEFSPAEAILLT